ncbi:MAG: hypothetical protein ACT4O9_12710 [Blastocatellia bacterium]
MRNRRRLIISTSILVTTIGAIFFAGKPQPSSGQIRPLWNPCGCFCGFEPPYPPVPPDPYRIFNKEPCTGILAADACSRDMSNLPADQIESVCEKIKGTKNFKSFKDSCPVFEKYCGPDKNQPPEDKKPKCDPPAEAIEVGPWNRADCKDFQDVVFRLTGGVLAVTACEQVLYKSPVDALYAEAMKAAWPNKICCDKLKGPRDSPCDYSVDLDCDGTPNQRDDLPDNYDGEESFYAIPPGTTFDPLPKGLRLSHLLPDIACIGCKWELVKGDVKCTAKSSRTGLFWYEATWKCPKTGMEVWRTSKQRLLKQKCKK